MNQKHSRKTSSTHSKPTRPGIRRNGSGYNPNQPLNLKTTPKSTRKADPELRTGDDNQEDMAGGLLQFCATCEKQIVTPGNSILYCSEACRKSDGFNPVSIQEAFSPSTIIPSASSYFALPEPEIVQPRSPTMPRRTSEDGYYPSSSDQRRNSEAARYLSQFYSQSYAIDRARTPRPKTNRYSTASEGLPSLSNTPSSSIGTVASIERPLPRKYNPLHSPTLARSADLLMPSYEHYFSSARTANHASVDSGSSAVTAVQVHDEDSGSYQRQRVSRANHSEGRGSLKQLFSYEGVRPNPGDEGDEAVGL